MNESTSRCEGLQGVHPCAKEECTTLHSESHALSRDALLCTAMQDPNDLDSISGFGQLASTVKLLRLRLRLHSTTAEDIDEHCEENITLKVLWKCYNR